MKSIEELEEEITILKSRIIELETHTDILEYMRARHLVKCQSCDTLIETISQCQHCIDKFLNRHENCKECSH